MSKLQGTGKTRLAMALVAVVVILAVGVYLNSMQKPSESRQAKTSDADAANPNTPEKNPAKSADGNIELVASYKADVSGNNAWCAPLQICWDQMRNTTNAGQALEPTADAPAEGRSLAEALNAGTFETTRLSDALWYSYAGPMNAEARRQIEEAIAQKFNQKSDILDKLDWQSANENMLLFYAMLYHTFSFEHPFAVAPEKGGFGKNAEANVSYFGTEDAPDDQRRDLLAQVTPLYYSSSDDCACTVKTKEGDLLVLVKKPKGSSFSEMWTNAMATAQTGDHRPLSNKEDFSCPKLDVDIITTYRALEGLTFDVTDGRKLKIAQAMQTLKMTLDNEGGSVKSEAAITAELTSLDPQGLRTFRFDDSFALFLVDGKATGNVTGDGSLSSDAQPYLALLVNDAKLWQTD